MELPEGYEKFLKVHHGKNIPSKTHCVLLLRALYGLVYAACHWYKKITSILGKLDFYHHLLILVFTLRKLKAMKLLLMSSYMLMMELFLVHQILLSK
jgi:hypothetical protein